MKEELARRVAASVALAMSAANTTTRTRTDAGSVVREVPARSDLWECTVCDRSMRSASMTSHLRGNPHAKNKAKWEAEQQDVVADELRRAEQMRIEEEKQEEEEKMQLEEAQRAEKKMILEEHRKNWELKQEELRSTNLRRIREKQQQNEHKEQEELRMKLVEQQRVQDDLDRDAAAASEQIWMAHENQKIELLKLQDAQEKQRTEWMKRLEEALAASRQMEAQLRIEQEDRRQEWMRKEEQEAAAAADLVRRKEQKEAWRQQELQREHEREEAQRVAEQAQMEVERRRREVATQQQQEVADQLALENAYIPSPGSSVGQTGWLEQGGPSTQNTSTGTGLLDASSEASIRRYLQWQLIIQEMHEQEVWMEQPLVLYKNRLWLLLIGSY